jgi:hypothetical protein
MQGVWVFASAAARDAAVTSPQEGNFAYLKDTNVTTYYTGSAWANLDTTGMTNPMTTTGDIIYSSPGSTPVRLGIGTANQVLQVNSGATAPEWATPAGGGGMTLISETVASSSTGIDFTSISGSYKQLLLVWSGVQHSTTGSAFSIRLNANSASNYVVQGSGLVDAGGGYNLSPGSYTNITMDGTDWMSFGLSASSATVSNQSSGYFVIDNYASSTKAKSFYGSYSYKDASNQRVSNVNGFYNSTTAITQLNIVRLSGSATISNSGNTTIRLYGIS